MNGLKKLIQAEKKGTLNQMISEGSFDKSKLETVKYNKDNPWWIRPQRGH